MLAVDRCVALVNFFIIMLKRMREKKTWMTYFRNCKVSVEKFMSVKYPFPWQWNRVFSLPVHICSVFKSPWCFETNKCRNPTCFLSFFLLRMNRPHHHKRKHTHTPCLLTNFFSEEEKKLEFQFFFLFVFFQFHVVVLYVGRTKIDLSHRQFFISNYANKQFF